MSWDQSLTRLRDVLVDLYPTVQLSREVVEAAGVPSGRIAFDAAATSNWHNILREAHHRGLVWVIVAIARREYPEHEELARAGDAYSQRRNQAELAMRSHDLRVADEGLPRIEPELKTTLNTLLSRHALFGGREKELADLDRFVAEEMGGYLFVTGPSGFGKTALLANWVQASGHGSRHASYHFISRVEGTAGEDASLRNLCQQLTAYHELSGTLPGNIAELRALYPMLLSIPPDDGEKLVVVLDGLDERTGWTPGLHQLFPRALPEGVFVLFSARQLPDVDWLKIVELSTQAVEVMELATMGTAEIAHLLRRAGGPAEALAGDGGFVEAVFAVSGGDPFYLHYLAQDIVSGKITAANIGEQPAGLDDYLGAWWKEVSMAAGERAVQDLLGYMLVAKGPLRRDSLIDISDKDALSGWVFDATIDKVQRYVVGDEERGYSLSHWRFGDYIARKKIKEGDQRPYRQGLLDYCTRWREHEEAYVFRYYARHLADVVRSGQQPDRHAATTQLVKEMADGTFQDSHLKCIGDPVALLRDVELALSCAAAGDSPEAVPLVVEAALALIAFRRDKLAPAQIFARARLGDVKAAMEHLTLFAAEQEWQRATLLLVAWHAAGSTGHAQAQDLYEQVVAYPLPAGPLTDLAARVKAVLEKPEEPSWPEVALQDVPWEEIRDIVARLGGMKGAEGLQAQESYRMAMELPPSEGEGSYDASLRVTLNTSLQLVAYAANHPEEERDYVGDHLEILAANSYVRYRNRFLWPVLGAVLMHPDPSWAQDYARRVAEAALATTTLCFQEGLPVTVWALQARAGEAGAWEKLDGYRRNVEGVAVTLVPDTSRGDSWGSYTRRLAALAEAYHLLGLGAEAQRLLDLAGTVHYGFAGLQSPAWLTLAEAMRVCGHSEEIVLSVLDAARESAYHVQEPAFRAQTTARYNALAEDWWGPAIAKIDLADAVRDLVAHPEKERFAALHRVGEDYGQQNLGLAWWAEGANTVRQLAELYGQPMAEFERLNPPWPVDEPWTQMWLRVPDPELAPLLAARLAAEVLVAPELGAGEPVALIQRLVPVAANNPTALDTVLARLLLAASPAEPGTLAELEKLVKDLPVTPVEKGYVLAEGY